MNLDAYFKSHDGIGIFSTADGTGKANGAVYAKPHIMDSRRVAFIMRDRLSHRNLGTTPRAHYLFVENGTKSKGIRLHLEVVEKSSDKAIIERYSRRTRQGDDGEKRFFVTFEIVKARKLLGDEEITLE